MSKLYIKPYDAYQLSGRDFPVTQHHTFQRLVFSPDNVHSVSVVALRDGTLLISNASKIPFEISLSRNNKVMAILKMRPDKNEVFINNNWKVTENTIDNREIHRNPDLIFSPNLNINLSMNGVGRVDLKMENGEFATCVLSSKELLFVRMGGDDFMPQLVEFINAEAQRLQLAPEEVVDANPDIRKQIGQKFVEEWMKEHEWGLK